MTEVKRRRLTLPPDIYETLVDFAEHEGHRDVQAALATIVKFGSQHLKRCGHCTKANPTESNTRPQQPTQAHLKPTEDTNGHLKPTEAQKGTNEAQASPQEPAKTKAQSAFDRLNKRLNGGDA